MISSSPLLKLNEFLLEVQKSAHSLSILTFDDSKEWLQFNKIPNTNKVVFLPSCLTEPFNCYVKTCSLMLDLFTDILATNSSSFHHFTHKVRLLDYALIWPFIYQIDEMDCFVRWLTFHLPGIRHILLQYLGAISSIAWKIFSYFCLLIPIQRLLSCTVQLENYVRVPNY